MRCCLLFLLLLLFLPPAAALETSPEEVVVIGEGMAAIQGDLGAAEEEAVWDAKRSAVEQAAGILLRAKTVGRDFTLAEDEIRARTEGFVRRWRVVPDSRRVETIGKGRVLRLKVEAAVALTPIIRKLADIADVYDDLERPRLRVEIGGNGPTLRARSLLIAALQQQGFEIADRGPAEVVLQARIAVTPTLRLGDRRTPHGVGELVGACRARLTARLVSAASEEVLLTAQAEGCGQSFDSDAEAAEAAADESAQALLAENARLFAERLLARWARERQEGHVVVVQAMGLTARQRRLLRQEIAAQRGFRRFVSEAAAPKQAEFRFLTRLDTRSVRRRLSQIRLDNTPLAVLNRRGPLIAVRGRRPALMKRSASE